MSKDESYDSFINLPTGLQTLHIRRYAAKMVIMFKIHYGGAPPYLNDIIPDYHENTSNYNTRNKHN